VGAALVALALVAPRALAGVERAWMTLALALSRVTTPLFMGLVYLAVLTPIALVLRLLGRAPLRPPAPGASAWVERPPDARRSDLRRQF
jgi:dihydrodipicolinate synthase/N-acetylneuraminate lyase